MCFIENTGRYFCNAAEQEDLIIFKCDLKTMGGAPLKSNLLQVLLAMKMGALN